MQFETFQVILYWPEEGITTKIEPDKVRAQGLVNVHRAQYGKHTGILLAVRQSFNEPVVSELTL
jgi:hypothetical protein